MLSPRPTPTSGEILVPDSGIYETRRLKKIAETEERTWYFTGQPVVKTVPRFDNASCHPSPFPDAYILTPSGKWEMVADQSKLPGWHPAHCCGIFCDGQDGNGFCLDEKHRGPPKMTPLEAITRGAWDDEETTEVKHV